MYTIREVRPASASLGLFMMPCLTLGPEVTWTLEICQWEYEGGRSEDSRYEVLTGEYTRLLQALAFGGGSLVFMEGQR